ncbi:MAG: IPT/TIG domain-containing protein [Candidatus Sericytochromatia bacterium]|nr:IPT/TIG domain-containing protein [Candidatus Tanganyikabacteria bacterium]
MGLRDLAREALCAVLVAGCAALPGRIDESGGAAGSMADRGPVRHAAGPVAAPAGIAAAGAPALAFEAPEAAAPGEADAPLPGRGHVLIRIKWPERSAQQIPQGTAMIRVIAASQVEATYKPALDFTPGVTSRRFNNAPAGSLTLSAYAYDSLAPAVGANPLATASADLVIRSGGVVGAKLVLNAGKTPSITSISPTRGAQTEQLELAGANFGASGDAFLVYVDGKPVPGSDVFRTSGSQAYFKIPAWATRSVVTIDVVSGNATQSATAPAKIDRLTSIILATTSISLRIGATASIGVSGLDTEGTLHSGVKAGWSTAAGGDHGSHDHSGGNAHDVPALTVTPDGVLKGASAGDFHVMARNGNLLATASVTVIP